MGVKNYANVVRPPRACGVCGITFIVKYRGEAGDKVKYCSRKCGASGRGGNGKRVVVSDTKSCEWCGSEMRRPEGVYPSHWARRRFCGDVCRSAGRRSYRASDETRQKMKESRAKLPEAVIKTQLGKPMSEEHKKKLSEVNRGRSPSPEVRKRISDKLTGIPLSPERKAKTDPLRPRGETHYNWQGGITPINRRLRHSKEYREWRKTVFERDNYTCQMCGIRGGELHPDHIKPFAYFPELRFDVANGRTLCAPCHRQTDTWGANARRYARAV